MATIDPLTLSNTFEDMVATINAVATELNTNVLKVGDLLGNLVLESVTSNTLVVLSTTNLRGVTSANANLNVNGTVNAMALAVAGNVALTYLNVSANLTVSNLIVSNTFTLNGAPINTTAIPEGTNQYYTNARARAAISNGSGIAYSSSTGVITNQGVTSLSGQLPISVNASTGSIAISISDTPTFGSVTTANVIANGAVTVGANVSVTTSTVFVGNATVNTSITAGSIGLNGAVINSTVFTGSTYSANNASYFNGQAASYYTNASNITTGTLANAQLSGAYTGVTGLGTLSSLTVSGNTSLAVLNVSANLSVSNLTVANTFTLNGAPINTSAVPEGTNLYHTDARSRAAVSNGTGLGYNSSTGVFTNLGVTSLSGQSPISVNASSGSVAVSISDTPSFTSVTVGNFVANTTALAVGTQVVANMSAVLVGNSTVNTQVTATGLTLSSTLGLVANQTNQLLNVGGQLVFNGQRVATIGPYSPNNAVYGYASGGSNTTNYTSTTDRLTFSTGASAASTITNLSQSRNWPAGISDTSVYGYAFGGYTNNPVSTADRVTFSTSTTAVFASANLSVARHGSAGISDGGNYGYVMGGYSTIGVVSTTDRIAFSTSATAAQTASDLSQAKYRAASVSDGIVYGYVLGGTTGGNITATDRISFGTGTSASYTAANISLARAAIAGVSDTAVYGYSLGGESSTYVKTAERITFSTSSTAAYTAAQLSQTRSASCGTSDGAIYGYVLGGISTAYLTTADRITFSTSSTAAYTTANLTEARYGLAGLSDGAV